LFKILEKLTAKNKKQDDIRMPSHLSAAEQKQVQTVIDRARGDSTVPHSAQDSIPFQRMFPDGICRVTDNYYTKTIQFQDINYQLAQQEDQTAIFEEWCSFLNFFDSSIRFELSFMNMATDASNFEKMVRIPYQKDHFNPVRTEYSTMLRRQLAQGNNGLTKTKYLTFGIEAESMKQAKPRLIHIEIDLMNNFKRLGVRAKLLNGKERLHLMHDMFHMGDHDRFNFDWKWLPESGLSVKDFIAPTGFAFPKNRIFQMGGMYGSMSYLQITASDLSDQLLKDFLDMESSQIVTMHIQSVDQNKAIKSIKHTITELDRSKIEEQKKAVRSGYDMDIIPSDLATYGKDAKALLKELQSQNERMFLLTFLVMNTGETEQELETNVFQASSIAQKYNCNLRRLDFQQEQGLMSCLPLAQNLIEIQRSMTTSSTAIFVPFTTQELFQTGKEALYYGLNALSNNLIMVDRKKLKNPNGLILGTPGSGKSFSAKREIANAFLVTDDDVIVCDPEAEYTALVKKFEGQVIKISPSSTQYINPMDINANYSEEDNPIALKADFILSLCELIVGGKHLIDYAKTKDVFAAYKASGYNREFYEAHRDMLALRSAAKKAFDAYKKENGSDKKLPRISELNAEYAMLLERKKSSYAEYRKTKSEMQDWLVAQKIVQEILKEDEQKKEQLHEQEVRQEEENRQSSR
jgi:type IV secretory pathway VirB4 component